MKYLALLSLPGFFIGAAGNFADRPFWEFVGGALLIVAAFGLIVRVRS